MFTEEIVLFSQVILYFCQEIGLHLFHTGPLLVCNRRYEDVIQES